MTDPLYIPETLDIGEIVNDVPVEDTAVTLLNVSLVLDVFWYLIIDPTFIPVKTFPGLLKVLLVIAAPTTPLGSLNLSNKQFALKFAERFDIEVGWLTDLISSEEYDTTDLIDLGKSKPLIINCSPTENVPEVCLKFIVTEFPPAETENPLAPLLLPVTNDVAGNSVSEIAEFSVIDVYVWISYKYKSQLVAFPL